MEQSHHNAARYLESAAKHQKLAAEHFARGEGMVSAHHAHIAYAHMLQAMHHHEEAAKRYAQMHPLAAE